jgi:23S rRNA pseudouridine1911/1915/1917 synthase
VADAPTVQAQARVFDVGTDDDGRRLDVFVAARVEDLSRARAQSLIRDGHVLVNGRPGKPSLPVTAGERVSVSVPAVRRTGPTAEDLPLSVLYEDADIAVVNKPAGLVVHPAAGHASGTLVNALMHHLGGLSGIGGTERPGIIHRLDKGTSGVMVVAKHDRAHEHVSRQFQARTVEKTYQALVWGRPRVGQVFDHPIGRDPRDRKKMSSRAAHGRSASTSVTAVVPLGPVSFVDLRIGTGRTHQIRVHLAEADFPVVGDALYGGVKRRLQAVVAVTAALERPFLHARRLSFLHPVSGQTLSFEAPLPSDLVDVLDTLRRATASAPLRGVRQ